MDKMLPAKFQSISFLVVIVIAWSFYPCKVISRPEPENTWYNIGPQSNQSVNTVVTIANITPPTDGPTKAQHPPTPAGNPIQPSNPAKPVQPAQPAQTTKPVQPVTQSQKGPETPSSNVNITSTSTPPTANSNKTTATGQSTDSVTMTGYASDDLGHVATFVVVYEQVSIAFSDIKSVGCYRDSYVAPRPLPKLIADFRDDSEHAKQRQDYNATILACGRKAAEIKFGFFGIQSNGECWSGEGSEKTYSRDGPSTDCHHGVGNSGSNYVYRFVGKHSKPCKDCGSTRTMCFPATGQLQLQNGFPTTMKNLNIGDKIKTIDILTNQIIFTEVIAFLHKSEDKEGLYQVLELEDGIKILLSARHLIYAAKTSQSGAMSVVYAEDVTPGNFVLVSGKENAMRQVLRVTTLTNKGIYAPMTRHGTMLVDDVLVSCYAHWRSHDIAHKVMAPVRIWYDITSMLGDLLSGPNSNNLFNGIHWYASFLMSFSQSLPSSVTKYLGK